MKRNRTVMGYLVACDNGLQRWSKSDMAVVPWTLYSSVTKPTIFPDLHAARVAIREAAKYWSIFSNRFKRSRDRTTPKQERSRYYVIRAEIASSAYDEN